MGYIIKAITKPELTEIMLEWAKKLGWKYSQEDVDAYFTINGTNIYSLKFFNSVNNEYELIGCVSISKYHENLTLSGNGFVSSIGLFVMKEEYRGKNHGQQLLDYALNQLTGSKVISLNSVPKVSSYYARNGFFRSGTVNNHFSLTLKSIKGEPSKKINNNLMVADPGSMDKIFEYEQEVFNEIPERKSFLNVWLTRPDSVVVTYLHGHKIEGYCVLTVCDNTKSTKSYRISPMIANTIDVAAGLFYKLFSHIENSNFDVIELNALNGVNPYLMDLLKNLGFNKLEDGDTELMVTKPNKTPNTNSSLFKVIAMNPLEFPHEELQMSGNVLSL